MNILTAREMQQADAYAIEVLKVPSIQLMENAAAQVVRVLRKRQPAAKSVAVVCGKGNNGGDGLAVARLLQQSGWQARAILVDRSADLKPDPAINWKRAVDAGVACSENANAAALARHMSECEFVLDAIFGTGLAKPLEGRYAEAVDAINRSKREIGSIDVPSGLSSDSGVVIGPAVRATWTLALAALKHCHVLEPAREYCGFVYAADIGIPTKSDLTLVRRAQSASGFPQRTAAAHKGTFGHAVIIAGSTGKSGAAYMAGKSALRAGAGLVTVASPAHVQPAIAALGPEIMTLPVSGNPDSFSPECVTELLHFLEDKQSFAMGPGIGEGKGTREVLHAVLSGCGMPAVLDADALNIVAEEPLMLQPRKPETTVLTPHPGEMARLLRKSTNEVQSDRIAAARKAAADFGCIVVLKGYRTVIATPAGQAFLNPTGCHALASAGTGDVLTGAIASLLAQRVPPLQAAITAVYTHGLCGNLFERQYPNQALNAMDIPGLWNRAVHETSHGDVEGDYLGLHLP